MMCDTYLQPLFGRVRETSGNTKQQPALATDFYPLSACEKCPLLPYNHLCNIIFRSTTELLARARTSADYKNGYKISYKNSGWRTKKAFLQPIITPGKGLARGGRGGHRQEGLPKVREVEEDSLCLCKSFLYLHDSSAQSFQARALSKSL